MSSRHGFEPFTRPDSPSARISELQRQNDLLREANAVLKEALVGVVDRYKKLAEKIHVTEQDRPPVANSGRDLYDEDVSPTKVRSLDDITTNVIQAVVSRFAEPSTERRPSPRGGPVTRAMEKRARLEEVHNIVRSVEGFGLVGEVSLIRQRDDSPSVPRARGLSQGSSVVRPNLLGEESRIIEEGSPNRGQ